MAREVAGARRAGAGRPVSVVLETDVEHVAEAAVETSRLKRKLADAKEFVITAEVEPPKGADSSAAIEGARLMKAGGVDAVNVTDNPMARLRMSSIAVAALIQRETGLDAVVQITTRDRNVLGLQSDLLGAAGLGVKAILCLGGDPLKIGDYPQAKQVSEVDVLGLLRIAKGLNAGRGPRRQRHRRADALCRRLRRQPGGRGPGGRVLEAARQDRGRGDVRPDPAGLRPRGARAVPRRGPRPGRSRCSSV